jgi:hypothetical protein
MIEAQLVLQLLEIAFDAPSDFRQPDQILKRHIFWEGGKPVASGFLFAGRLLNKKPFGRPAPMEVAVGHADP